MGDWETAEEGREVVEVVRGVSSMIFIQHSFDK